MKAAGVPLSAQKRIYLLVELPGTLPYIDTPYPEDVTYSELEV